jgi:uncharacterized protein YigE (DUF2233 family)
MGHLAGRLLAAVALILAASSGAAAACRGETLEGSDYTVCSFDLRETDLRIFWRDGEGTPYRTFGALQADLATRGSALQFAMNGGMYGDDFSPTGLLIEDGKQVKGANLAEVRGEPGSIPNFYKKPNGVFYLSDEAAGVRETEAFVQAPPGARFATQSGPMLVIDGAIHPAFIEGSTDRKPRNGVGVSSPTDVHFVISEDRVNFHDFARFFRDGLGCDNALFLDGGSAPGLFAPELGRNDPPGHGGYGPIIGAVEKAP